MSAKRKYTPARALAELAAQHDALRGMMDRCLELADLLDAGQMGPMQLTREVSRLRLAFEAHNAFEEEMLRPVLLGEVFGDVRIDRLVDDHIHEHREMRAQLNTSETSALRETIEQLRAHLEAEERYLLNARVLRDDIVTVESTG
jgi:hypothetical protein